MLEQSLPKLPPHEASLALLAFLRDELPAGGAASEQRFVTLFPLLMERLCGMPVVSANATAEATNTSSNDAWLSLPAPMNPSADPLVKLLRAPRCLALIGDGHGHTGNNNSSTNNNNGAALTPTLLDAIGAESKRVLFDYPLNALDDDLVECWREYIIQHCCAVGPGKLSAGSRYVQTSTRQQQQQTAAAVQLKDKGHIVKLFELLPQDQPALRQNNQLKSPLLPSSANNRRMNTTVASSHGSPFGSSFGGSPLSKSGFVGGSSGSHGPASFHVGSPSPSSKSVVMLEPKVQLTMLQYYFLLFLRFPLLENQQQHQQSSSSGSNSSVYGRSAVHHNRPTASSNSGSIYSYLFQTYLTYYLPTSSNNGFATTPTTVNTATMHPTSTLFLCLIIEFWLCRNLIPTTETSLKSSLLRITDNNTTTLRDCIDISRVLAKKFQTLPLKIQNGILATVKHLLGDLSLRNVVKRSSEMICTRRKEEREGNVTTPAGDDKVSTPNDVWCLPPAMSEIQQSLLNYIRVGLASGSIHNKDSSFHKALEVWLLWIEPWNFVVKKRMVSKNNHTGTTPRDFVRLASAQKIEYYTQYVRPKPTSRSGYNQSWEAYVVSNLYFYVLPLSIFLRRARELEFSNANQFTKSLSLVQRVLRCYPSQIVNVLNYARSRADGVTSKILERHLELLGPYAPPEDWKLSHCQVDAMNLLEEIFGQHQKKVGSMNFLDRWEARIDALFSGSMQNEDGALQIVLGQLKCLVGLPLEYSVATEVVRPEQYGWLSRFFGRSTAGMQMIDTVGPDRTSDGLLTDLGRMQLASGKRKCSPFDVHYIGDPMLAPYRSHEVPAIVDLAIILSNYVNDKLGLVPLSSLVEKMQDEDDMLTKNIREMERYKKIVFRINLRFLADYRNVLAISFVVWFMRKLS